MRVMIVVTHLLGTGHLARALTLGRAFAAAGDTVTVISGGTPVPHFDSAGLSLVQLPPLRSDGTDFTNLLTGEGGAADHAYHASRTADLIEDATQSAPDVLITELFPFGRRSLKHEFQALLQACAALRPRPLILSSIRDILAPPSKPAKITFADDLVSQFYDGVLVHSDPDVIPLERSWPVSNALRDKLYYTGFVAPPASAMHGEPDGDIIVSAGGGSVGDAVFAAACAAASHTAHRRWRMLVGGDDARRAAWADRAPAHMTVEAPRSDFRTLLTGAAASVSMCGYNTALDVLQTGVPAVLVPFDDGGEVEQTLRAEALQTLPGITVVPQAGLDGVSLTAAVDAVVAGTRRLPRSTGMNGARKTVDIVHALKTGGSDAH
ncbi:glycosyltransferase family protein [uncultured Tateyamaria sp.]|uniref:glycosyltransferase family protein n=1 Tax=uncultured Tateyamaria sp. TaxID=455651 RepID=UPI0026380C70|nr:glycosyltransferase [uncultured Tateyamaria sp.]